MNDIFSIQKLKFSFEQEMKDEVILKFSNKQGGDYNVFSYHWQCLHGQQLLDSLKNSVFH